MASIETVQEESTQTQDLLEPQNKSNVENALRILDLLLTPLSSPELKDKFKEEADELRKEIQRADTTIRARSRPTIIAITGGSGEGKSSLINAILNESELIPTSCLKACTAIPIEVSFNHEAGSLYRATVEILSQEEWKKDVEASIGILRTGLNNRDKKTGKLDSESTAALHKLQAVYPFLKDSMLKQQLAQHQINDFMSFEDIPTILGATIDLVADDAASLRKSIERYVASAKVGKEKGLEYWPLVKRVRIFTRAAVLENGAVIADVPGSNDTNAARVAAADRYLQDCDNAIVVVDITRAATNKFIHDWVRTRVAEQLRRDGTLDAVTVICTKTDVVNVKEVQREFDDQEDFIETVRGYEQDLDRHEANAEAAASEMTAIQTEIDELDVQKMEISGRVRDQYRSPSANTTPRKRSKPTAFDTASPAKRRRNGSDIVYVDLISGNDYATLIQDEDLVTSTEQIDLTSQDDDEREPAEDLEELRQLELKLQGLRISYKTLQQEEKYHSNQGPELEKKIFAACLKRRNQSSKELIQARLGESIAALRRGDDDQQEESSHDQDNATSPAVKVFCVSSQEYGYLSSNSRRGAKLSHVDETGIPEVQSHIKALASSREEDVRAMQLHDVRGMLTQLSVRLSTNLATTIKNETAIDLSILRNSVDDLQEKLFALTHGFAKFIEVGKDNLIATLRTQATPQAASRAPFFAKTIGYGPDYGEMRKIHWKSYNYAANMDGDHPHANAGPIHLNRYLVTPFFEALDPAWISFFNVNLPREMHTLWVDIGMHVSEAKRSLLESAQQLGFDIARRQILEERLQSFETSIRHETGACQAAISARQKAINRMPERLIKEAMKPTYEECAEESGPGMLDRMRQKMAASTEVSAASIKFVGVADRLAHDLEELSQQVGHDLQKQIGDLCQKLQTGVQDLVGQPSQIPEKFPSKVLDEIRVLLNEAVGLGLCDSALLAMLEEHTMERAGHLDGEVRVPINDEEATQQNEVQQNEVHFKVETVRDMQDRPDEENSRVLKTERY